MKIKTFVMQSTDIDSFVNNWLAENTGIKILYQSINTVLAKETDRVNNVHIIPIVSIIFEYEEVQQHES